VQHGAQCISDGGLVLAESLSAIPQISLERCLCDFGMSTSAIRRRKVHMGICISVENAASDRGLALLPLHKDWQLKACLCDPRHLPLNTDCCNLGVDDKHA
jgi:hypothetical protein